MKQLESYIALDLETTGLNPKKDKIIEIGAVKVCDGNVVDTFQTLVYPGIHIKEEVEKLTGISNEMVKYAYNINEVVPKFLEFAKDLPLVGHNIMFDYSFIKKAIVNYGEAYERLGIDTLKLSRKFLPNLEKKNLNYVCEYLNIKNENHHRALNDALAAHIIFEKLKKQFYHSNLEQFQWKPLLFKVKKEQPMTKFQKEYLIDFIKYHKIVININIDLLTKSECSRLIDTLISQYGRVKRNK